MARSPNPVLYQNSNHTTTLLDIPVSIALAQGNIDHPNNYTLLSSEPQEEPYITNEPKSGKAREKLQQNTVDARLHEEYRALIEEALAEIRMHYSGKWCLPRKISPEAVKGRGKKRKAPGLLGPRTHDEEISEAAVAHAVFDLHQDLSIIDCAADDDGDVQREELIDVAEHFPSLIRTHPNGNKHWNGFYQNSHAHPIKLTLASIAAPQDTATFRIPPYSSFRVGKCDSMPTIPSLPSPDHTPTTNSPPSTPPPPVPKFSLILLDPPWPNRSVRRSSSYTTSPTLHTTRTLLTSLNLPHLLQPNGHIAIWVTNRPSFRHLVLSPPDGLFASWNIELAEEWLWVKVTAKGAPITPLDGLWRKPYEVLLIGRLRSSDSTAAASSHHDQQSPCPADTERVKRRVIAAVPDLHSRKPCLKHLFPQLSLLQHESEPVPHHVVLEIFARNLVAGWSSWGDEVLKFNRDTCWVLGDTLTSP